MYLIVGLLLSILIGLSLGFLGGGGSLITVPVLVYVLGVAPHQAIGMSLAVVGATSGLAATLHYRRGTLRLTAALLLSACGIPGAYFGARLTYLFSPVALLLTLAVLMLTIAGLMLGRHAPTEDVVAGQPPHTITMILAGLGIGVLTGLFGVGGGFLLVPALTLLARLRMKDAIGTSLLVIAINAVAGLLGHLQYGGFDLLLTVVVTTLAVLGMLLGVVWSARAPPARLRTGFALFMIAVAIFLVVKNYPVFP